MPHKKSASTKEFHRNQRTQRKLQAILFQAIPKLFARLDALFEPLQIDVVSFWVQKGQWTSWGEGEWKFDKDKRTHNYTAYPYITGFVQFKNNKYVQFQFHTSAQSHEFTEANVFGLAPYGYNTNPFLKKQTAPIKKVVAEWYRDTLNMYKMEKRMNRLKEDIVAAAWHPRRVAAWLEAGCTLEDM